MTEKCYSLDGEDYNCTTFSELIDNLQNNHENIVGVEYYEADAVSITHYDVVSEQQESLLEIFDARANDMLGEIFDWDYTAVDESAKDELRNLLIQWANKHVDLSRYYFVKNSIVKIVNSDDVSIDF